MTTTIESSAAVEQFHASRARRLGASDIPAILGFDEYRSASDVWLEKTGQVEPFAGNDATRRGQYLEPGLIMFAERETGLRFQTSKTFVHPSDLMIAHPDGMTDDDEQGLEAKSTIIKGDWDGEPMTDQVPDRVLTQVAAQFVCCPSLRVVWVPVAIVRFDLEFRLYRVERNTDLVGMVEQGGLDFMRKHVVPRIPPTDFKPSLELLKRVKRVPNKVTRLDDEILDNFILARANKKQAEDSLEIAQRELLTALGDAEAGEATRATVTYMESKRKGYTVAESTCRTLRTKLKGAQQS